MRRRAFIGLLGCTIMWPLQIGAQHPRRPVVGVLYLSNPEPIRTFLQDGFAAAGYAQGQTIHFESRTAGGDSRRLAEHAAELVREKVDLIVAVLTPAVQAAMRATQDIPVVMIAGAPVEAGLVASLSHPGGNVTGVSTTARELAAKTLEITRDVLPALRRVGVLVNGNDLGFGRLLLDHVRLAAEATALEVFAFTVGSKEELDAALASVAAQGADVLIAQPSLPRGDVLELARKHRLPTVTSSSSWTDAGALMSYGPDLRDVCRKAAAYADRILKGAKPGDLPIEQPTKFELTINLNTAKALGIEIPAMALARDVRVIE